MELGAALPQLQEGRNSSALVTSAGGRFSLVAQLLRDAQPPSEQAAGCHA
jgi:hypothetical protein